MQRVNSVSDVARNPVNPDTDQIDDVQPLSDDDKAAFFDKLSEFFEGMAAKENPAVTAAGLNDSDQTSALKVTGEEFVAANRTVLQGGAE